jgi:cytochrome b-561
VNFPWYVRSGLFVYVLAIQQRVPGKLTFLQAGGLGRYSSKALLVNFFFIRRLTAPVST